MCRKLKKFSAVVCLATLLFVTLCGFRLPTVAHAGLMDALNYKSVTIYVDGIHSGLNGYLLSSETYVALTDFSRVFDLEYEQLGDEEGFRLVAKLAGHELRIPDDGHSMQIAGRYFYLKNGVKTVDNKDCLPIVCLAKLVGLSVRWDAQTESVNLDTAEMCEIAAGEDFYNEDDLYWLSRIIFAESGGESLEGKLGVGNVVLNRVERQDFPNTVEGVVFDRTYGVQFSPADNGSIYMEPSEESVIAAKMCLEGCSIAGDSIYFVNPGVGLTSWFRSTRTFVASIGDHDFYA